MEEGVSVPKAALNWKELETAVNALIEKYVPPTFRDSVEHQRYEAYTEIGRAPDVLRFCLEEWERMSDDYRFDSEGRLAYEKALVERMNAWLFANEQRYSHDAHTVTFRSKEGPSIFTLQDIEGVARPYQVLGSDRRQKSVFDIWWESSDKNRPRTETLLCPVGRKLFERMQTCLSQVYFEREHFTHFKTSYGGVRTFTEFCNKLAEYVPIQRTYRKDEETEDRDKIDFIQLGTLHETVYDFLCPLVDSDFLHALQKLVPTFGCWPFNPPTKIPTKGKEQQLIFKFVGRPEFTDYYHEHQKIPNRIAWFIIYHPRIEQLVEDHFQPKPTLQNKRQKVLK